MNKNQVYRLSPAEIKDVFLKYKKTDAKIITIDGENIVKIDDFFNACCKAFELKFYGNPEEDDDFFPDYDIPDPFHGLSHELCFSLDHLVKPDQEIVLILTNFYGMVPWVVENAQILGLFVDSVLPYYDLDQSSAYIIEKTDEKYRRKFNVYLEC